MSYLLVLMAKEVQIPIFWFVLIGLTLLCVYHGVRLWREESKRSAIKGFSLKLAGCAVPGGLVVWADDLFGTHLKTNSAALFGGAFIFFSWLNGFLREHKSLTDATHQEAVRTNFKTIEEQMEQIGHFVEDVHKRIIGEALAADTGMAPLNPSPPIGAPAGASGSGATSGLGSGGGV